MQQAMAAYLDHKAGPFAAAPTTTGFASLEKVEPNFPDAEKHIQALVAEYAKKYPDADPAGRDPLLARQLLNPKEAVCQIVTLPLGIDTTKIADASNLFPAEEPGMWMTMAACSTRSLSRGSIHINSSDPTTHPTIDPAYLKHPLDVDMMARSILHVLSFTEIEPIKSVFRRDENGELIMAKSGGKFPKTLDEAKEYIRSNTATEYHPVGTCAMLPKEKGGVVSDKLKVYGTSNVSLVYALAEKASDIIKGDVSGRANGTNGTNGTHGTNGTNGTNEVNGH
jgi:choline dehydrogenase